jgi:hypothetical protein
MLSPRGKLIVITFSFSRHFDVESGENLLPGFFACDFLARFVVVVHPTTIFWSSITRSANA